MVFSTTPARTVFAAFAAVALLGTACGGDDGDVAPVDTTASPEQTTTTTLPADDDVDPGDEALDEAGVFMGCQAIAEAVESYVDEELVEVSSGFGGGLTFGGVPYSTVTCTVGIDGTSYHFAEYVAVEAPDGTPTRPLALWEEFEAVEAAGDDADERAEQLIARIEAVGADVDGALDDGDQILLLVGDSSYGVSFAGIGVEPTAADLEGLAEVAVAVAQAAPSDVDGLCDTAMGAVDEIFGGHEGDPGFGGGGGMIDGIEYETESCRLQLNDSDLSLQATISDQQHWEAASAGGAGMGPGGTRGRAQAIDGVGDGAFISGSDLVVRIGDHVLAVEGRLDRDQELVSIPPADLVELAAAVFDEATN